MTDERLFDPALGGRSLDDPVQLALTLGSMVKDGYPINGVPPDIADELRAVRADAERLERRMRALMERAEAAYREYLKAPADAPAG